MDDKLLRLIFHEKQLEAAIQHLDRVQIINILKK